VVVSLSSLRILKGIENKMADGKARGSMNTAAEVDNDDDGAEDSGLVPAGIQVVKCLAGTAVFGKASTGTEQIGIQCEITKGKYKGRTLNWYGAMTEKALDRTLEQLALAGCTFPGGNLKNLAGLGSTEFECQVEHSEHPETGDLQSRISWFGTGVAMKEKLDDGALTALSKRVQGNVMALKKRLGIVS